MTSATKSSCFFSMPAPTSKRSKRSTVAPARLEQLLDGLLGILDERLAQQRDFVQRLAQPALDHLGDDLRALAFLRRLLSQDLALLGEHFGRHLGGADVARIAGRHVHRQVMRQRGGARLPAPPAHRCACRAHRRRAAPLVSSTTRAADADVLADLGHQRAAALIDALAGCQFGREQRLYIDQPSGQRQPRHDRPRSCENPARGRRSRSRS